MNKFLLRTFSASILLLFIFGLLDFVVTKGLKKSDYYDYKEWNEIYKGKVNAEIVINGSSKAEVQFATNILDSVLLTNSYNLGINGHYYHLQSTKYNIYLANNNPPKVCIQVVSYGTFEKRPDLYEYEQFFPYLWNERIRKVTAQYEGFSNIDYYIPLFRYFKKPEYIIIGLQNFIKKQTYELIKYKGYYGRDVQWDSLFHEQNKREPNSLTINLHEESLNLFKNDIIENENEGILTIMVFPPMYFESLQYFKNMETLKSAYQKISETYNIPYLDYSNDSISYSKKYFYNTQHLNKTGAELFSKKLAEDLKQYLKDE